MRTRLILVVIAATALIAGAAIAAGTPTNVKDFNAKYQSPGVVKYSGKIDSDKARCFKNRRYEIIHNGVVIVSGRTDDQGKFSKTGPQPPNGDKVTLKILRKKGCKRTSETLTFSTM